MEKDGLESDKADGEEEGNDDDRGVIPAVRIGRDERQREAARIQGENQDKQTD